MARVILAGISDAVVYLLVFIGVVAYSPPQVGREDPVTPHPVIKSLKPVVGQALSQLDGASATISAAGVLIAEFRVHEFQVHTIYKNGRIGEEAHPERGPNVDGLRLEVHIQSGARYEGALMLSSDGYGFVRHPYWETQVRYIPLPSGKEYAWSMLSFGSRTDRKLMQAVDSAIAAHIQKE